MPDDPQQDPLYFPASTGSTSERPPMATTTPNVTITMRPDGSQWGYAPFNWTGAAEKALNLLVEGVSTIKEIAEQCHVSTQAVYIWRQHPDFMARVKEYRDRYAEAVFELGISRVETRVAAQHDRWMRMRRLIEARAADIKSMGVAGGGEGIMAHSKKMLGSGPTATEIDVYEFDAALVKEMRELEKEASIQLGQRLERKQTEIVWDGDLSKLSGEQRERVVGYLEQIAFGGDAEAIKAARLEAGVFEPEMLPQEPV